jgi:hypothetical protein
MLMTNLVMTPNEPAFGRNSNSNRRGAISMTKLTRSLVAAVAASAVWVLVAIGGGAVGAASTGRPDRGVLYVAITHTVGSTNYLAGNASDKLFGSGAATYKAQLHGVTPGTFKVTGPITVFVKNGSLAGKTSATAIVNSNGTVTFTTGKLNLPKGAGGQNGHSFVGTFTGTGKAATGPYVFHYKGTYK